MFYPNLGTSLETGWIILKSFCLFQKPDRQLHLFQMEGKIRYYFHVMLAIITSYWTLSYNGKWQQTLNSMFFPNDCWWMPTMEYMHGLAVTKNITLSYNMNCLASDHICTVNVAEPFLKSHPLLSSYKPGWSLTSLKMGQCASEDVVYQEVW